MKKRLIEYDPLTCTSVYHEYDPATDTTTISEIQDVEHIIESNKAAQNYGTPGGRLNEYERDGIKREWTHVAQIPTIIIEKWRREEGIDVFNKDHLQAVVKKLNDPDWRYLRTGRMRV